MKRSALIAFVGLLALLTGCSGLADSLGFGRNPPDEFAVVDRPPLAMPPDYDLRPPRPGAPRPQEISMNARASTVVFGAGAQASSAGQVSSSDAEKVLLESAGAAKADENIRDVVDREAAEKVASSKHLIDDLLWWRKTTPEGAVVDPAAEAERLKKAKEKGEPVNEGKTPVIERRKSGWIGF